MFVPAPVAPEPSTDPNVGRYTLDMTIFATCPGIPGAAKARRYTADIDAYAGSGADYVVRLYDARFGYGQMCLDYRFPQPGVSVNVCNQIMASRTDDSLRLDLPQGDDDSSRGTYILEELVAPTPTWLEVQGSATGRLQNGTITAMGRMLVHHWVGMWSGYSACTADARLRFSRQ